MAAAPAQQTTPPNIQRDLNPWLFKIAPPTGLPTKELIATNKKNIPNRVPMNRLSFVRCTITVGGKLTSDPETNPKRRTITMIAASLFTPTRPMIKAPEANVQGTMTFMGPVLSAIMLGKIRPKTEAALRIGMR